MRTLRFPLVTLARRLTRIGGHHVPRLSTLSRSALTEALRPPEN